MNRDQWRGIKGRDDAITAAEASAERQKELENQETDAYVSFELAKGSDLLARYREIEPRVAARINRTKQRARTRKGAPTLSFLPMRYITINHYIRSSPMKPLLTAVLFLLAIALRAGEKTYPNVKVTTVEKVHDGDTMTVFIKGWPGIIGDSISVRVSGVNAPEITSDNPKTRRMAQIAKAKLQELLLLSKTIILKAPFRDKYFRINAGVLADKEDIGKTLVQGHYCLPYDGSAVKSDEWEIKFAEVYDKYFADSDRQQ